MRRALAYAAVALIPMACARAPSPVTRAAVVAPEVPVGDYHQHLFSPTVVQMLTGGAGGLSQIAARDVIALLDSAGIRRAVVLSVAYMYGSPARTVENEYAKVRAENDWTAQQAALYPARLRAFCSFNPLKEYALEELARCGRDPRLRNGLKLHIGNSVVDYHNPRHVEQVRAVFRSANQLRMPIVIHMRASISQKLAYGADEARIFLNRILPAAPDVVVQIAHLAGAGGYDAPTDGALSVLADAIANDDQRTRNVYFDLTAVAPPGLPADMGTLMVARMRQIGMRRLLYGTDAAAGGNLPPRESWAALRRLPLTATEFRTIAANVPPYMR